MPRLAFHTFGLMRGLRGSDVTRGFVDRTPDVFAVADGSPGFIDRALATVPVTMSTPRFTLDFGPWGRFDLARFYTGERQLEIDNAAASLSLWQDVESVRRFAYSGDHLEALRKRADWFLPPQWPTYVMWWVDDTTIPTWTDAAERLEHLHDHGPTEYAFNFKQPFPSLVQ